MGAAKHGSMRRVLAGLLTALLALGLAGQAAARSKGMQTLGKDPSGDAPPGLDLTYLQVGRTGSDLEIRIGLVMVPPKGSYPQLPGIEWIFETRGRTFIAEAVATTGNPLFFLFEQTEKGYTQLGRPEGTFNPADGYTSILVPLEMIDAKRGTVISGVGPKGTEDVDAHVHAGPTYTHYPDRMATTKDFVVR